MAAARRVVPGRLSRHADPAYHSASLPAALLRKHRWLACRAVEDLLRPTDRLHQSLGLGIVPSPGGDFGDLVPLATAAHAALPFKTFVAAAGKTAGPTIACVTRASGSTA